MSEYVDVDYWVSGYAEGLAVGPEAVVGCYIENDTDYWGAEYAECGLAQPEWGTFPRRPTSWWPSAKKKIEEEFEAKVEAIVEPLPDKSAEIITDLSRKLVEDRMDVAQLRKAVKAKHAEEEVKFTAATMEAVTKVQAAAKQAEAEQVEIERQRKEQRNRNAIKILRMLH